MSHNTETYENHGIIIEVKYHDSELKPIELLDVGDWIDLRAAETVLMKAGDYCAISLGVSMKLPEGYEAYVVPRSSTFKNYGIIAVNHIAIIDNSYNGDSDIWRFQAYCLKPAGDLVILDGVPYTTIHKNDRICQFRIMKNQPGNILFPSVEHLNDVSRGGFGSTGIN